MKVLLPICLASSILGILAATSSGCGLSLPPGAVPCAGTDTCPIGSTPDMGMCSQNGTYYIVTVMYCGYLNCPDQNRGAPAYALCDGTSYSACTCTEPSADSGWTKVGGGDSGPPTSGQLDAFTMPDVMPDLGVDTAGMTDAPTDAPSDVSTTGDTAPTDTGATDAPSSG